MVAPHSKGPWVIEPVTGRNGNIGIRANGDHVSGYVAFVDTRWPHPEQQEEQIANARLIAAAPELVDALAKLSNEVLGSLPLVESAMRQEIGNTNYRILIQRAEEARALIAAALSTDAKFAALRAALA